MGYIKLPVALICLLLTLSKIQAQPMENVTESTLENSTTTAVTTTEPVPETYEYIAKLVFGLRNDKIPEFILNAIFDNSNNITTTDILALYGLESINLTSAVDVLEKLNYKPDLVFSIRGLERFLKDFHLEFTTLYNNIFFNKLNITGLPLRQFLIDLNINHLEFADAMAYGERDPLEIFKLGNFTFDVLEAALNKSNKSTEDLFLAVRDEVVKAVKDTLPDALFNILKQYNFDRVEAMNLWIILELSVENVESIPIFSELLDNLKFTLENGSVLGVLTSKRVAINKDSYDNIKDKMQLTKIFAQSLYDNLTVELLEEKSDYENIVILKLETDNFTTFIEKATTKSKLENCQFITLEDNTLISHNIENVENKDDNFEISKEDVNITDLIQGSPLVCKNKVYGLAKKFDNEKIIFDTFIIYSGVIKVVVNPLLIVVCSIIYLKL